MPELPEVETVRLGLERTIKEAVITRALARRKDLRFPLPDMATLNGKQLIKIERRAKYLLFYFDSQEVLIAHLGMTGRFSVLPALPSQFEPHDHVVFSFADGRALVYNDPRRFGLMTLVTENDLSRHSLLKHLGVEPLSADFTVAYLKSALGKRSAPIKTVLMDQAVVVGVGNIYASEALYLAGILPTKPAKQAVNNAGKLLSGIKNVLNAALVSGGSSLKDFVHVSGESGYFQHHFNVYEQKNKPCPACKTPIAMLRQAGRSTYYCPRCQS